MYLKILKHATITVKQQQHDGCVNVINRLITNPGDLMCFNFLNCQFNSFSKTSPCETPSYFI